MTNDQLGFGIWSFFGHWALVILQQHRSSDIDLHGAAPTSCADGHFSSSLRYSKNRLSFRKCFSYKCQLAKATSTEIPIAITIDKPTPRKLEPVAFPNLSNPKYFVSIGDSIQ